MAYKSKFLHFKTKASYEAERAKTTEGSEERKVFDAYISFIDEGPTICTWGKEYQCDANSLSVLPQELTTEEQNQALDNIGLNFMIIEITDGTAVLTTEQQTQLLSSKGVILKGEGLGTFGPNRVFIPYNPALSIVQFYSILSNKDICYLTYTKATKTIKYKGSIGLYDQKAIHTIAESLSIEDQNQVFKNLGWNVHIISQSDINAGSSPSNEEKAKRLEATALLVKETSLIYVRGKDDSANSYFFRISSSTQIEVLRISTTTGIIYPTTTQFIDTGTIRFDRTQTLSDSNKTLARENIDAANKNDVLPLTIDLSSQTVEDYNTALEAFNSKKPLTIFDSTDPTARFTASTIGKETNTDDIDVYFSFTGINNDCTFNTIGYNAKIKPTGEKIASFVAIQPSNMDPKPLGQASPGIDNSYSRSDHIHPIQESVAKLTTPRTIALTGAVSGSTTFDGSSNVSINSTLANIDASKITSGTINADRLPEIPISKIPAAAMERLYVVESQSAAMSLTIQEGDVVQIGSGGPMYFCVSESASTFATKFKEFTAGTATSVPWSGVTGAPTLSLRSLQVNTIGYQVYSNVATSIPMIYAPTEIGTSGQILQSTGNGAPKWVNQSSITANPSAHTQSYTTLTGSTITANQAIVSNGTANGWTLKTLGSLAFSSATIPTKTSQLTNDSGFLTSVPAQSWSSITDKPTFATVATSGSYNDLTNKPTIPSAYTLPTANASTLGGVKIGSNITVSSGTISLSKSNVTSALGYTPSSPLIQTGTITNNTITAGYAYDVSSAVVNMVSGFSKSNPDAVVATASKITSFPSECSVMDGIMDLNGSVYVYCFTYIGGTVYINGAVYA